MSIAPGPAASEPFLLVRATQLRGLPVVGISSGEALADIRDVVYSPDEGRLQGFTLNKHGGLLAGPLKQVLPIERVHAIGRDAVMVTEDSAVTAATGESVDSGRDVLGNQVLTDAGDRLGAVDDLVVAAGILDRTGDGVLPGPGGSPRRAGDVVGYEVVADSGLQGKEGSHLLVPLPTTLAVSGETLLVPAAVRPFIRDDLAGFGAAVEEFRAGLEPAAQGARAETGTAPAPEQSADDPEPPR